MCSSVDRCRLIAAPHSASLVLRTFLIATTLLAAGSSDAKEPGYQPRRLANGQPDFQGIWDHSNATPLARLEGFATLEISREQALAIDKIIRTALIDKPGPNDPDNEVSNRRVEQIRGQWRSSIVVDPSDGKLPGTPSFEEWNARSRNGMDGPEQRDQAERCITDLAAQAPMLYNPAVNLHQIVQTDDTILFHTEAMHDTRIVRLNAKHAPAAVTSWLGDSIGWWDGDTLVVETKHFTPSNTGRRVPFASYRISPEATVTERFKRVSDMQLDYSFTVHDPINYTRPWSGETQFMRSDERIFEYACHEGNYSLLYILQSARAKEASAEALKP